MLYRCRQHMQTTTAPNHDTAVLGHGAANFPKRHAGQFRKGHDPRRLGGAKLFDGMTVAQIARKSTPRAIALLERAMDEEAAPWAVRIRAAEILLDRGHGKPVSVVEMQVNHTRDIATLTRDELRAIAAGHAPRTPITFDGEASVTATATAHHTE